MLKKKLFKWTSVPMFLTLAFVGLNSFTGEGESSGPLEKCPCSLDGETKGKCGRVGDPTIKYDKIGGVCYKSTTYSTAFYSDAQGTCKGTTGGPGGVVGLSEPVSSSYCN